MKNNYIKPQATVICVELQTIIANTLTSTENGAAITYDSSSVEEGDAGAAAARGSGWGD